MTVAVTNNYECCEAEVTATLYNLGNSLDGYHFVI
jgi:hypothetical protein